MFTRSKRIIAYLAVAALLTGCGSAAAEEASEVELIEPVGNAPKYDYARRRELSRVSTYQGVVCPDTVQYAYESSQPFGNYRYLPGDEVHEGDTLYYGTSDQIEESIEQIEEENETLLADYTDYLSDYSTDLAKAKKSEFEASYDYQNAVNTAPPEDSQGYAGWARGAMPLESKAKSAKMAREKLEQAYRERSELFDLEYEYNETRIARLEEEKNGAGVTADSDGVVVAMNSFLPGDQIPQGTDMIAVGDPSDKEIVCDFISKAAVSKAEEIYAIIDGERYEVTYEVMEPEEYRRIKKSDDDVYTTFKLNEGDGVSPGQYAVIVVVEKRIEDALCVPGDAVNKDESGTYVYLYDGTDSVYTAVTVGESEGGFTQIIGGLAEGDRVICESAYTTGTRTAEITKGEVLINFSADGYLYYPASEWTINPARYGTCYINEICVDRFEQITEGQTLAKVEVVTDEIEIERIKRKISRQNERINDLNEKKKTTYDKESLELIDRSIRDRNRTIESLNRQLEKMSEYSGLVEIKSPCNGIVTETADLKDGQIISYREKLVQVASENSCFIAVEDNNGVLSYGDTARVSGYDSAFGEASGQVVTLSPCGLSKSLRTGYALIRIPPEYMSALAGISSNNTNGYWTRARFNVKCDARKMKNVLLIPKNAIYRNGTDTYVYTKDEKGEIRIVKFIAGGSDNSNYWVAYGDITEGMVICYE